MDTLVYGLKTKAHCAQDEMLILIMYKGKKVFIPFHHTAFAFVSHILWH